MGMPFKLTAEQRDSIARRYAAGESGYALAKEYGIRPRSVYSLLETRGVAKRVAAQAAKDKTFITPDFVRRAVELYEATKSSGAVARSMGCSPPPVLKALRSAGVEIPESNVGRARAARLRIPCNDSVFNELTTDALYWIGFLWADGYVGDNQIVLVLSTKDREQVEAFRSFCGSSGRIYEREDGKGHRSCGFTLYSAAAARRLRSLGFVGRKPPRVPPPELASSSDFWRGVIDGDGTVGVYCARGRPSERVSLVGGHGTVNAFLDYVRLLTGEHGIHASDCGNYAQTQFNGRRAYDVLRVLYSSDGPALARKKEKALAILRDRAALKRSYSGHKHFWQDDEVARRTALGQSCNMIATELGVNWNTVGRSIARRRAA